MRCLAFSITNKHVMLPHPSQRMCPHYQPHFSVWIENLHSFPSLNSLIQVFISHVTITCHSLCQDAQWLKWTWSQMWMCMTSTQINVPGVPASLSVAPEVCQERHLVGHVHNQTYTFSVLKIIRNIQSVNLGIFCLFSELLVSCVAGTSIS